MERSRAAPRCRRWCFTVNNPTQEYTETLLETLRGKSRYFIVGYERGESGTPHLQGFVCFPNQLQRRTVAKRIPGAYLAISVGTVTQNRTYCTKDGDYYENGSAPQGHSTTGGGNQWTAFEEWISSCPERPTEGEIWKEFPNLIGPYPQGVNRRLSLYRPPNGAIGGDVGSLSRPLRPWQRSLVELIGQPPDDRIIRFYVDEIGNQGKSYLCRHLLGLRGDKVQVLGVGKRDDVAYMIDESKEVFIFDMPRSSMEFFPYALVEKLKDGFIPSPKYTSVIKYIWHPVHVIVFCNEPPDLTKLSPDRYVITELSRKAREQWYQLQNDNLN